MYKSPFGRGIKSDQIKINVTSLSSIPLTFYQRACQSISAFKGKGWHHFVLSLFTLIPLTRLKADIEFMFITMGENFTQYDYIAFSFVINRFWRTQPTLDVRLPLHKRWVISDELSFHYEDKSLILFFLTSFSHLQLHLQVHYVNNSWALWVHAADAKF